MGGSLNPSLRKKYGATCLKTQKNLTFTTIYYSAKIPMGALKLFSFASSAFQQSIRFNGVGRSALASVFCSVRQRQERNDIDLIGKRVRSLCSVAEIMSDYEFDQPNDDGKLIEKDAALRLALTQLASEFGRESMLSLQRFFGSRHAPIISTGSLKLDLALGTGGLPKGRIVEIYGREASGKTTLALHIIKEAQKLGGYCAYVDVENALDPSLAESIGVNIEDLLISHLESAESSLSVVDTLIKSGAINVIVVDSVAALVPQCELDSVIDGTRPKGQSRLMTQALRKLHSSLCQSQTLLVFINQVRSKPCAGFGHAKEVTCGGNALKFYAAVRMRTMKTGLLSNENEITGVSVSVQIVKNKLAPAMKKAELEILFGRGITSEAEVLEMACTHGVISKMRDGYYIEGEVLKDKEEAEMYLSENHEVLDRLVSILRSQLFKRT